MYHVCQAVLNPIFASALKPYHGVVIKKWQFKLLIELKANGETVLNRVNYLHFLRNVRWK